MFAGISTADQLPRVRYNRNFWLVLFMLSCFAGDRHRGRAPTTEMNQLGRRDASAVHHHFVIGGLKAAKPRRPTYGRASRRSTAAAAAGARDGPCVTRLAAAAGGGPKRRGRHSPRARTGRRASFHPAAGGGMRLTPEQGGDARCVLSHGRVPAAGPPGAGGPQFPPQAGARAVRRPLAPEPLVACPCAA